MVENALYFDTWIRNDFVLINTELEALYFALEDREQIDGVGDDLKHRLVNEGKEHVIKLLAEGNTDEGFEANFNLMGNVGLYIWLRVGATA